MVPRRKRVRRLLRRCFGSIPKCDHLGRLGWCLAQTKCQRCGCGSWIPKSHRRVHVGFLHWTSVQVCEFRRGFGRGLQFLHQRQPHGGEAWSQHRIWLVTPPFLQLKPPSPASARGFFELQIASIWSLRK